MSAELLRRAAKQMRERAEAATPGPWTLTEDNVVTSFEDNYGVCCGANSEPTDQANVRHIASWDPDVAVGIASLFDNLADELERVKPCEKDCANCSDMRWSWPTADLVAKDYLAEDAS